MTVKKVLVLRSSDSGGLSHDGFQWPEKGICEAPDFEPTAKCGNGLHGLLWGTGDTSLYNWSSTATWQVVEVKETDLIDIGGDKVKFPRGKVVCSGSREKAWDFLMKNGGADHGAQYFVDGSHIVTNGIAFALGNSTVKALGNSTVKAFDNSTVSAEDIATIIKFSSGVKVDMKDLVALVDRSQNLFEVVEVSIPDGKKLKLRN